ncbi:MAG: hypothetical protein WKH64_15920 [Chloroflexia bacterium]
MTIAVTFVGLPAALAVLKGGLARAGLPDGRTASAEADTPGPFLPEDLRAWPLPASGVPGAGVLSRT